MPRIPDDVRNRRNNFESYLQGRTGSIRNILQALGNTAKLLTPETKNNIIDTNLFSYSDAESFQAARQLIEGDNNFKAANDRSGNCFERGLDLYEAFLSEGTIPPTDKPATKTSTNGLKVHTDVLSEKTISSTVKPATKTSTDFLSKKTITNDEMWDYIHRYYGYGCVDAPVYLIGQEEGGGNIDYRYDRFINAEEGTFIDTPNPIDPPIDPNDKSKYIRTLDGSAFHKVIRRLEKKEDLVNEITDNLNIAINNQITKYIDYNNESDRALTIEIDDLYKKITKEFPDFLLDEERFRTSLTDGTWLYSGNTETEWTQRTFTPIVTHIISPLYKCLYKKNEEFKEKEFQAKYMARTNSPYKLFVSDLYPFACKSLDDDKAWNDIMNFTGNTFESPITHQIYRNKDEYYLDLQGGNLPSSNIPDCYLRFKVFARLISTYKPKIVIMYGRGEDFNPFWDKIADCKNNPWNKYSCGRSDYYITDNKTSIFVKMGHPLYKPRDYCPSIYSSIVKYSQDHHISLS